MNQYKTKPNGPVKQIEIREIPDKNFGILYLNASLDTQEPKNKFIPKKCIQKINKKISFENNE